MEQPKKWLIEQMKIEEPKGQTPRFWRLKDWLTRVSMAEFKSTELRFNPLFIVPPSIMDARGYKNIEINSFYEALVAPIKDEIKEWENK
jgi:hypothetical protein